MGRALIIGAGGVASVVVHKCCQNSDVFEEICIASRTKSKCDALKEKLGVDVFENTKDGKFCIQTVRCIGCCGMAPVISINGKVYGNLTTKKVLEIVESLD